MRMTQTEKNKLADEAAERQRDEDIVKLIEEKLANNTAANTITATTQSNVDNDISESGPKNAIPDCVKEDLRSYVDASDDSDEHDEDEDSTIYSSCYGDPPVARYVLNDITMVKRQHEH